MARNDGGRHGVDEGRARYGKEGGGGARGVRSKMVKSKTV